MKIQVPNVVGYKLGDINQFCHTSIQDSTYANYLHIEDLKEADIQDEEEADICNAIGSSFIKTLAMANYQGKAGFLKSAFCIL